MIRACLFLCFLWACAWFFVMTFSLRMTVGAGQLTTSSEVFLMEYASNGKGNLGVTLGAIGTGLGVLNGGLGGILGGFGTNPAAAAMAAGNSDNHYVSRYEAGQSARIAELETEVKLRDANAYTDKKMLELYQYTDGRMRSIEEQLCQQRVINAQTTANLSCMQNEIATLSGMTKTVIPISNICPEPMQRYNSWTAPTGTATTSEG